MVPPMAESGPIRYAKALVKNVLVSHCFDKVILRRLASSGMRNPTKKFLTLLLALAVACLPLQAFACNMDPGQAMGHSAMDMSHMDLSHMDHGDGAGSNCCDAQHAAVPGGCAWFMHCGSCVATASLISAIPQAAFLNLPMIDVIIDSGEIAPSHSSPPYHPPTIS